MQITRFQGFSVEVQLCSFYGLYDVPWLIHAGAAHRPPHLWNLDLKKRVIVNFLLSLESTLISNSLGVTLIYSNRSATGSRANMFSVSRASAPPRLRLSARRTLSTFVWWARPSRLAFSRFVQRSFHTAGGSFPGFGRAGDGPCPIECAQLSHRNIVLLVCFFMHTHRRWYGRLQIPQRIRRPSLVSSHGARQLHIFVSFSMPMHRQHLKSLEPGYNVISGFL